MSILKEPRERAEPLNVAELAKLLRPFLHLRAPGNPVDLRWEDLGELATKEFQKPKDGAQ